MSVVRATSAARSVPARRTRSPVSPAQTGMPPPPGVRPVSDTPTPAVLQPDNATRASPSILIPPAAASEGFPSAPRQRTSKSRRSAEPVATPPAPHWNSDGFLRVAADRVRAALLINVPESELRMPVEVFLRQRRAESVVSAAPRSAAPHPASVAPSALATPRVGTIAASPAVVPPLSGTTDAPTDSHLKSPSIRPVVPSPQQLPATTTKASRSPQPESFGEGGVEPVADPPKIIISTADAAARAGELLAQAAAAYGSENATDHIRLLLLFLEDPRKDYDALRARFRAGEISGVDAMKLTAENLQTPAERKERDERRLEELKTHDLAEIRRQNFATSDEFPCPACGYRESLVLEAHDHDTEQRGVWGDSNAVPLTMMECVKCGENFSKPTGS